MNFNNASASEGVPNLINKIKTKLKEIQNYFEEQRLYHYYSSSILIAYDAETLKNGTNSALDLRIVLIDFARAIPANGELDNNYLNGVKKVSYFFETMLK